MSALRRTPEQTGRAEYHEMSVGQLVGHYLDSMEGIGSSEQVGYNYWLDPRSEAVIIRIVMQDGDDAPQAG